MKHITAIAASLQNFLILCDQRNTTCYGNSERIASKGIGLSMSLSKIFEKEIYIRLTEDQDGFVSTSEFPKVRFPRLSVALRRINFYRLKARPMMLDWRRFPSAPKSLTNTKRPESTLIPDVQSKG